MASDHYRTGPGKCVCGFDAYKLNGIMLDYGELLSIHIRQAKQKASQPTPPVVPIDPRDRNQIEAVREAITGSGMEDNDFFIDRILWALKAVTAKGVAE